MTRMQRGRLRGGFALFAGGGIVYTAAELLWRGHSHWTMTLAGGFCALLIHLANRRMRPRGVPLALRCLAGCGIITAVELSVGCVVNRLLGWNVWDYSSVPLNFLGQICPLYCVMWFLLSLPVICVSGWLEHRRRAVRVLPASE